MALRMATMVAGLSIALLIGCGSAPEKTDLAERDVALAYVAGLTHARESLARACFNASGPLLMFAGPIPAGAPPLDGNTWAAAHGKALQKCDEIEQWVGKLKRPRGPEAQELQAAYLAAVKVDRELLSGPVASAVAIAQDVSLTTEQKAAKVKALFPPNTDLADVEQRRVRAHSAFSKAFDLDVDSIRNAMKDFPEFVE